MARISRYRIDSLLSGGDLLLGTDIDSLNATRRYTLNSLSEFIRNDIEILQPEQRQGFRDTGTRAGGNLIAIIGDFDDRSNGTKIILDDVNESILLDSKDYIRTNHNLQIGDISHDFYGIIDTSELSEDRTVQIPDASGFVGMTVNNASADSVGNIEIDVSPEASDTVAGRVELATLAEVNTGTDTLRVITPAGLEGSDLKVKLDTIEEGADITNNARVNAAGATMNADGNLRNNSYFLEEDDFASNDATKVASQRSIKTYVDNLSNTPVASDTVSGTVELATLAEVNAGTDTTRAITPADLEGSNLKTKLDTVESGANVTNTASVNAAGATLNTDTSLAGNSYFLDQDDMSSDDSTKVASQQSIKAYVDDSISVPSASETVIGRVELATLAEVNTGTDTTRAVTPAGLEGSNLKTKLDGIETNADVTDAANVNSAGATMNNDTTLAGNSYFLDEDDFDSDDSTKVASQQSIKSYVDDAVPSFPAASQTAAGVVELATLGEVNTGTDNIRAITPRNLDRSDLKVKLDGIETNADVTDAANVNAAGATLNSDTSLAGNSYFLDEDDMSSDDATKVASQQSIKAYVDNTLGASGSEAPDASETVAGIVELATVTEVNTGTDATRAITPASLEGSALKTKLDTVETNADVTDATNVNAAGATMNNDTTLAGNSYFLDQDNMSSNDATKVASQQSIKTYVDDAYSGGIVYGNRTVSASSVLMTDDDYLLLIDSTLGNIGITIPTGIVQEAGKSFLFIKTTTSNGYIINTEGTETINGSVTHTRGSGLRATGLTSDGSNWFITALR